MNIQQAIDYIHSVNWVFCKPGLDRIDALCEALGNPQDGLKFIHVAGTNGKGSFCAMTASMLQAAGYRTGLFTSPYIVDFNERMQIDGENISNEELIELVEIVRPIADAMADRPTEFELITALAFLYFARHNCDVVVLECGLGGRLDATNVITTPVLSVITGIALDHTAILGDTIEQIAAEKAGIIKDGVSLLWCGNDATAEAVIRARAEQQNAPVHTVLREDLTVKEMTLAGTVLDFGHYHDLTLPLLGSYQPHNAANALSAIDLLPALGFTVREEAVRRGLAAVRWPARFEIIGRDPLIIADGGHNPEGIDGAIASIRAYFGDRKVGIVTGVMADKDVAYMTDRISEVASAVFCLTPDNPRALPAAEYASLYQARGISAKAFPTVRNALSAAVTWAKETGRPLVSLGSLYMYGEIRQALKTIQ